MAVKLPAVRLPRTAKRAPCSFYFKISVAVILALSFVAGWTAFSSPASSAVASRRESFDDIESDPTAAAGAHATARSKPPPPPPSPPPPPPPSPPPPSPVDETSKSNGNNKTESVASDQDEGSGLELEEGGENDPDMEDGVDVNPEDDEDDDKRRKKKRKRPKKNLGPLFDPKAQYDWKLCAGKNKHNYVPCVDMEAAGSGGAHRHHERSCPRHPLTCLVPMPQGYGASVPWPESRLKVDTF